MRSRTMLKIRLVIMKNNKHNHLNKSIDNSMVARTNSFVVRLVDYFFLSFPSYCNCLISQNLRINRMLSRTLNGTHSFVVYIHTQIYFDDENELVHCNQIYMSVICSHFLLNQSLCLSILHALSFYVYMFIWCSSV